MSYTTFSGNSLFDSQYSIFSAGGIYGSYIVYNQSDEVVSQSLLIFTITRNGKEKYIENLVDNNNWNIVDYYAIGTESHLGLLNTIIDNLKNEVYRGNYGFDITKVDYNKMLLKIEMDENHPYSGVIKEIGFFIRDTLFIYGKIWDGSINKYPNYKLIFNIYFEI